MFENESVYNTICVEVLWEDIRNTLENFIPTELSISDCRDIIDNFCGYFESSLRGRIEERITIEWEVLFIEWLQDPIKGEIIKQLLDLKPSEDNTKYLRSLITDNEIDDQLKLLDKRGFNFDLFIKYLDLITLDFPLEDTFDLLISQLIEFTNLDRSNLLLLSDDEWKQFLDKIETTAQHLNIFFSFFQRFVPAGIRLHLRREFRSTSPLYQNIMVAKTHLYQIALIFSEISLIYSELIHKSERKFTILDKEKVSLLTKKVIWGELGLDEVRENPEMIVKEKGKSMSYYSRVTYPDRKKVKFKLH